MMLKQILETNGENLRKQIYKEFGKSEKDINECVNIVEVWLDTQPHFPERPSKSMINTFLQLNKFSIEKTKQKLDMYYTIRSLVPEIFSYDPLSFDMIEQSKITYYIPLPKLTDDSRRVIFSKINGDYPVERFNHEKYLIHAINVTEVQIQEDKLLATHFILDCQSLKAGHVPKFSPMVLKKGALVLEKVYSNRVSSVHLVNFHPYLENLVSIFKMCCSPKIASRIKVHKSSEALFDYFPRYILPRDCGGTEDSLESLNDRWLKKLEEYKPRLEKLSKMKVNEGLRPSKLINDEVLGFYGNFKTIEID